MMTDYVGSDCRAAMQDVVFPVSRVLRAEDYRRMRWKNGAGWTSEVLRIPECEDWDWRLSIAEIETDAPFSVFPGMERLLVLLDGNGLRLRFDDGKTHALQAREALHFSGERLLVGELLDGPTRDFNVMWKRGVVDVQHWCRPLVGSMVLFAAPGEDWVVHMLEGQAHFTGESTLGVLGPGDTAVLQTGEGRARHALDGSGAVLLVRVAQLGKV